MKNVIKKSFVLAGVLGFMALSPAANAVTSANIVTVHHYSCPNGGVSDGQGNCNIPATAGTPAVPQQGYNAVGGSYIVTGSCGTFDEWLHSNLYNSNWNLYNNPATRAANFYSGCTIFGPAGDFSFLTFWHIGDEVVSGALTCPSGGTLSGSYCITSPAIPAIAGTAASSYQATDAPTTASSCPDGTTQVGSNCYTQVDAQSAIILSPFDTVKNFITNNLLPVMVGLVVLGIGIKLGIGAVQKYAKKQ